MYLESTSYCVGGVVSLRRQRRRWGQLEGDALPAEAADAEQDAAEDGEQEIWGGLILSCFAITSQYRCKLRLFNEESCVRKGRHKMWSTSRNTPILSIAISYIGCVNNPDDRKIEMIFPSPAAGRLRSRPAATAASKGTTFPRELTAHKQVW